MSGNRVDLGFGHRGRSLLSPAPLPIVEEDCRPHAPVGNLLPGYILPDESDYRARQASASVVVFTWHFPRLCQVAAHAPHEPADIYASASAHDS